MIDPYFLDRLENWSRAIRSAKKCNTSSMYQVMIASEYGYKAWPF